MFWQEAFRCLGAYRRTEVCPVGPDLIRAVDADDVIAAFFQKWNALPVTFELAGLQMTIRKGLTVLTGRWGVVPIFPWTTDREIHGAATKIRRRIGKAHQDAQGARLAAEARWLKLHGFTREEIAREVHGRRSGFRRPSAAEAIARMPEQRERDMITGYLQQGMSHQEATRRVIRAARGSEAPAAASVRMATRRLRRHWDELAFALAVLGSPADPISHAVTMLLRDTHRAGDELTAEDWIDQLRGVLGVTPDVGSYSLALVLRAQAQVAISKKWRPIVASFPQSARRYPPPS